MRGRLPPVKALIAFEAAARHESFAKAANELCVTPAAISHQIKALESHFASKLFERHVRKIALTSKGRAFFGVVADAFDRIDAGSKTMQADQCDGSLTIALPPHFSLRWAMRRLARFRENYPEIRLAIVHTDHTSGLPSDKADVIVRWGVETRAGWWQHPLFHLEFVPMCSSKLNTAAAGTFTKKDFSRHSIIHVTSSNHWKEWFQLAGWAAVATRSDLYVDDYKSLVQAVLEGQGIGLCPVQFVKDYVDSGALIRLSDHGIQTGESFYVACPNHRRALRRVDVFLEWIVGEARSL